MSLVIALGSNLNNPVQNLERALEKLQIRFELIEASRIYKSKAVDYENQPDFFNQVLEFKIPHQKPDEIMNELLQIEWELGRMRNIPKGPRIIDIDIIFWGTEKHHTKTVQIPHPRFLERSFVIRPLQELPFFQTIEKCFTIPKSFQVEAEPI